MTCVAAVVEKNGRIWMGADSAATDLGSGSIQVRTTPKVFVVGEFLVGSCGSLRTKQVLQYRWSPPPRHPGHDIESFMVTDFIDSVRDAFKGSGSARTLTAGSERGATFMVGYAGRLFTVYDDYDVCSLMQPFAAIGAGVDIALGALHVCEKAGCDPEESVQAALEAAARFNATVRGPFTIACMDPHAVTRGASTKKTKRRARAA